MCQMTAVTSHTPHVTHHASHVTRHTSHVTLSGIHTFGIKTRPSKEESRGTYFDGGGGGGGGDGGGGVGGGVYDDHNDDSNADDNNDFNYTWPPLPHLTKHLSIFDVHTNEFSRSKVFCSSSSQV